MGAKNSSLTRVQPVINELLKLDPTGECWLQRLCEVAASTRAGARTPNDVAKLLPSETPPPPRIGTVFERVVPPPTAFLRWLIENPARMNVADPVTFGAASADAIKWRQKLFARSPDEQFEAQAEALRQLDSVGAKGSARK